MCNDRTGFIIEVGKKKCFDASKLWENSMLPAFLEYNIQKNAEIIAFFYFAKRSEKKEAKATIFF